MWTLLPILMAIVGPICAFIGVRIGVLRERRRCLDVARTFELRWRKSAHADPYRWQASAEALTRLREVIEDGAVLVPSPPRNETQRETQAG